MVCTKVELDEKCGNYSTDAMVRHGRKSVRVCFRRAFLSLSRGSRCAGVDSSNLLGSSLAFVDQLLPGTITMRFDWSGGLILEDRLSSKAMNLVGHNGT